MVGYAIPFGVPVSRKTSTGILKGRVYDAENPPRGLPRVLVRLNDLTAVTDRNGEFTFGSLRPGTYYLTLDKESIGMNRVTVQKSPLPVTVLAGKKNRIEVGVTRGAAVSGRVILFPSLGKSGEDVTTSPRSAADSPPPRTLANAPGTAPGATTEAASAGGTETDQPEPYGLANVLVELQNPSETLRRLTDRKGRFLFEDVRPGTWTLKLHEAGLPENHYLEQDTFTFELKPGETKEILARVLLKKRPIRIIEEGGVIEEEQ
jgi:hypothetical protein